MGVVRGLPRPSPLFKGLEVRMTGVEALVEACKGAMVRRSKWQAGEVMMFRDGGFRKRVKVYNHDLIGFLEIRYDAYHSELVANDWEIGGF